MYNQETFKVIKLLQNLSNSMIGTKNIYDSAYIQDVKKRLPKIENAFWELKNYLDHDQKQKVHQFSSEKYRSPQEEIASLISQKR